MNYIFLDFEMNQPLVRKSFYMPRNEKCPFEIIEFGAIKINESFEMIGVYQTFVKNKIYPKVNPRITELTTITLNDLENAKDFKRVIWSFNKWLEKENEDSFIFVWGSDDKQILQQNFDFHRTSTKYMEWASNIIDLQNNMSNIYRYKFKSDNIGMNAMLKYYNIPLDKKRHRAINDAAYTVDIFKVAFKRLGLKNALKLFDGQSLCKNIDE